MVALTAEQLVTYLSWIIFVLIFIVVLVRAIRQPSRANIDIALVFGAAVLIIVVAVATLIGLLPAKGVSTLITSSAILALPYLLVRLIDDIAVIALRLRQSIAAMLILSLLCIWVLPPQRPQWVNSLLLLYVTGTLAYVVGASIRAAMRARGVTRRRLAAMSIGSLCLVMNILVGSMGVWFPQMVELWRGVAELFGLASGISYVVGFAPPRWLRRAWQEPELRAFLGRAATLPRLPNTTMIVQALQQGAADSIGSSHALIGRLDETHQQLIFENSDQNFCVPLTEEVPAVRAFHLQQPVFSTETQYSEHVQALTWHTKIASAVMAAPITAGERRLGVLVAYAPRAPIFADDDLALIALLADQAAVILESRALIDDAARTHGREEAVRLKEDFLSAAAHDLKTPLTTIVARAQLMERRAQRDPSAPADLNSVQLLLREAQRLKRLVLDLLDAARIQQGQLVGPRETFDLVMLAHEICARFTTEQHPCIIDGDSQVIGYYDQQRIAQLIDNLVDNAIKYSPDGGRITIVLRNTPTAVLLSVSDHGIGIPADDIPHLFTQFYRGANVDNRRFPGMGLGLFICKAIVEQHGGQFTVQSQAGQGSTFQISLPLIPSDVGQYAT